MANGEIQLEPGTDDWRVFHLECGDALMNQIAEFPKQWGKSKADDVRSALMVRALAEVAQAHYLAANVRYKRLSTQQLKNIESWNKVL